MEEYSKIFKIAAYLLEYPDSKWWSTFDEYRAAIDELKSQQARTVLNEIFDYATELGAKEFENQYVRVFDFSQNTNLNLTTQERTDFGKQANEMHEYKEMFLENGFDVDNELPDYLPAILELAAAVSRDRAVKILSKTKNRLELLRDRFIEAKLIYAFLLDVVLAQVEGLEGST